MRSRILLLSLAVSILTSCASPIQYARPVHADRTRAVTLEARYGYGQEGAAFRFSHPLVLTEAQWHRVLDRVQIQPRNWIIQIGSRHDGPSVAFRDDEQAYLAKHLAAAFSEARPDEWVLFYLSRPGESGLTEITSGGFFFEESRLHLVLANYRLRASMPYVADQVRQDPLGSMGDTYYSLVAGEHQEVQTYHDWRLTKQLLQHPMELVSELDAELVSREPDNIPDPWDDLDLERRFRALERLRERDVITEEEYETKRRQLLEGL